MPEPQQQLEEMVAWELCRTHLCVWEMEKDEKREEAKDLLTTL